MDAALPKPPARPAPAGGAAACGLALPGDYLEFLERYGPGELNGFFVICAPAWAPGGLTLEEYARRFDEDIATTARLLGDPPPPRLPSEGAFLAFGFDTNANKYGWIVRGPNATAWTVAVHLRTPPRDGNPVDTGLPFGAWIAAAAKGEKRALVFDDWTEENEPTTWTPAG